MTKYKATELGRIYGLKEEEPNPWGWIILALFLLLLVSNCHH